MPEYVPPPLTGGQATPKPVTSTKAGGSVASASGPAATSAPPKTTGVLWPKR